MEQSIRTKAKEKGYFEALSKLYKKVPSGVCKGCTDCCSESVNISYVELMQILDYMNEKRLLDEPQLTYRLLSFYLLAYVKPQKCPFLEAGQCMIYEVRPLPCRIFGNRTREAYADNYEAVLNQNKQIALYYYKEKDLMMPRKVWNREIGYCEDYQRTETLNTDEVADLYNDLIQIDGQFYFETDEGFDPLNRDLVHELVQFLMEDDFDYLDMSILAQMRERVLSLYNHNEKNTRDIFKR